MEGQRSIVMAASNPRLGVAHPTVVPGEAPADGDDGAQTDQAAIDEAGDEVDGERDG